MNYFYENLSITPLFLSHLPEKKAVFELNFPQGVFDDEDMIVHQIGGQVQIELQANVLRIWGDVDARIELTCDRTLERFITPLQFSFEEALAVVPEYKYYECLEIRPDDASEQILPHEIVNLQEIIRQYIILNLPAQKLSSETCYNEYLVRVNQNADSAVPDPAWESIRQVVQSWEINRMKSNE